LPLILLAGVAVLLLLGGGWILVGQRLLHPATPPNTQQTPPEPSEPATTGPSTVPATDKPTNVATAPSTPVQEKPAPSNPIGTAPSNPPIKPVQTSPSPTPSSPSSPSVPLTQVPVQEKPSVPTPTPIHTGPALVKPTAPAPHEEDDTRAVTPALPPGTREWNAGLALTFNVKPPDLNVKLREISEERGTVIGEAGNFTGKKDAPGFTLPGPGEYLVSLVRNGETVATYLVHARGGGPSAPLTFDANAPKPHATGDAVVSAGARTVKERLILKIDPSSATVYVDGRAVGSAKDFSGGFTGSKVLQIPPGAHKLRIEAAGYRAVEYALDVVAGAPNDKDTLKLDLERD
jgi:hypothetical protein